MALLLCNLQPCLYSSLHHKHEKPLVKGHNQRLHFTSNSRLRLSLPTSSFSSRRILLHPPRSASINGVSVEKNPEVISEGHGDINVEFFEKVKRWVGFFGSILPGGSWWSFSDDVEVNMLAKPVTVWRALCKMWKLVAQDRWVIFAAFSALILAALSEISIPHYLTASIFSSQSGEVAVFHRNVRLLVLLCVTSGICSGVRGCCFGIANMILVKRMRETLYSSLLLQDISFFDNETVGDLTSRLGADCQQVSRVIGNDLNLILRNVLQGTGALIYLLTLSWPLGLYTLVISSLLSAVMVHHGRYQKKAAKLIQEFTASANEVAQETFSLIRTVRVYGTEQEELGRYNWWLGKLADISVRQSAAYGFWNLSFNILYHSAQIVAVLFGGMSILAGHITAEKLTKFILYSEWLILSTWWVGDNISSLMQSVGASEKVFQLMDLKPSDQFMARGMKLQRLLGHIEFSNISFYYFVPANDLQNARFFWHCFIFCLVPVLQNVSIAVHPSEVVAIVGLSGSGKSTLVNLLLRLYEPTNGQILIDGIPLKELDAMWWRERIGYVGQEPKLFRTDISSNIKYGCTGDIKQEHVVLAAKQAYAHDFISSLPNGYETLVDDDLLSATSALDAESEHNVKGVLRAVRTDFTTRRSVIVIAHRLSTIQEADRIVVMDGGQVVEMGSHRELLLKDGLYARLARRQADAVA
ncbi:ABC transporter B family protein [Quillaja saponaria]|uniref:ABC transporter B family protein n=1 Tax=Quillaja saponaria TaxID=32244 RepID=A0AAD7KQ88_QUISA|nr:ABC transporter B family protein [Quillaja saponaria]